ncbi:MAG TPA: alpha-hydroxy acid oxidase [Candidatus Dormibacteraeota bacterium]|jgi:isopentenyl diphosphate isomerase/L-lactate dehydrogenase-like FMN-dependent dehydrogenase|nr:alpha-hydroxy acid oxidase [Candidatus Dormibacteraeota bacterium]
MATSDSSLASRVVNIEDLRKIARRRLPRVVFDYLDGGADGEVTLRENCRVFDDVIFRPRQAVAMTDCDLRTRVLSFDLSFPAILAPVGYSRLMHPGGEVTAAAEAGKAGTIYTLSTISGHPLEKVRAATNGPAWYQLYLVGGRPVAELAIERAKKAGFNVLVVTVDTAVAGLRERDPRNGMKQLLGESLLSKLPYLPQILSHPGWLASFILDGGVPDLANIVIPGKGPMPLVDVGAALAAAVVTWEDFRWLRELWPGPIIAKGVLTGDDARRAVDEGAAAVVVSNHGGRQLDTVFPTLRALPEVVAAVRGQAEVLMDGGVRRGADIVKAVCLGARAVLCGRAYAYGLGAAGGPGVACGIKILREGVERTLRLLGCPSVKSLDPSYISVPHYWNATH